MTPDHGAGPQAESSSLHVRRASEGESLSVDWVVAHFTPFLRAQAEYRLRGPLRRYCEPEDLVNEVWAIVLPRLGDLRPRESRWTPVLLRFLSTTLLHRLNHLLTGHARAARRGDDAGTGGLGSLDQVPEEVTGVVTRALRAEACQLLRRTLDELAPQEQEILVLRGFEQLPYGEIARHLGESTGAATMRYHRTIEKLRKRLAGSILDELPDD